MKGGPRAFTRWRDQRVYRLLKRRPPLAPKEIAAILKIPPYQVYQAIARGGERREVPRETSTETRRESEIKL